MSAVEPARLAVVGSTTMPGERARRAALLLIERACRRLAERIEAPGGCVLSGGAAGVDTWAREVAAHRFGWFTWNGRFVEHLPAHPRWEPDGYKVRNLLIAADCTHLLRIYRPGSRTYGSGWTADRAEELGKVVNRYVWSPEREIFVRAGHGTDRAPRVRREIRTGLEPVDVALPAALGDPGDGRLLGPFDGTEETP